MKMVMTMMMSAGNDAYDKEVIQPDKDDNDTKK